MNTNTQVLLVTGGGTGVDDQGVFFASTEVSLNKLAKLGDEISISKSETITHSLTH